MCLHICLLSAPEAGYISTSDILGNPLKGQGWTSATSPKSLGC